MLYDDKTLMILSELQIYLNVFTTSSSRTPSSISGPQSHPAYSADFGYGPSLSLAVCLCAFVLCVNIIEGGTHLCLYQV